MTELLRAARLVAAMLAIVYCLVWAVWTFFGPVNHLAVALIALSYAALCIECWGWAERSAADSNE